MTIKNRDPVTLDSLSIRGTVASKVKCYFIVNKRNYCISNTIHLSSPRSPRRRSCNSHLPRPQGTQALPPLLLHLPRPPPRPPHQIPLPPPPRSRGTQFHPPHLLPRPPLLPPLLLLPPHLLLPHLQPHQEPPPQRTHLQQSLRRRRGFQVRKRWWQ